MLSYLHRYHAGCFADVHKHLILLGILEHLQKKPTPFAVLDSHAGEGLYDLKSSESQLNREFQQGFNLVEEAKNPPGLIQNLIASAKHYQAEHNSGRIYPGSPALIQLALREQDSAIFIEKHPQAFRALERNLGIHDGVRSHNRDAYEAIKAFVPFKEKRGLVFIDPSYEVKSEYDHVAEAVIAAHAKFSHGIFAIWYPILNPARYHTIITRLKKSGIKNIWRSEWTPFKNIFQEGILASGVIVINPPWQLHEKMEAHLMYMRHKMFPEAIWRQELISEEI